MIGTKAPTILRIGSDFAIKSIAKPLSLSSSLEREVETLWRTEKEANPHLFDGLIFSAFQVTPQSIVGRWINYRYALTVYRKPDLAAEFEINPVAVCGRSQANGHILIAKRASHVLQYPGYFELVPSGGIDPLASYAEGIDYRKALLQELEQETGISRQQVVRNEPLALIYDPLTKSWELVLEMDIEIDIDQKLRSFEYEEILWVKREELFPFLEKKGKEAVVPLTNTILQL